MGRLMKRRQLLQSVATLPILSGGFAFLSASAKAAKASATRTIRRVRPSDPSWPDAANWRKLAKDLRREQAQRRFQRIRYGNR
jgi:hypothetical protein